MPAISLNCWDRDWSSGFSLTYELQEAAGGIAQALGLAASWVDDDDVAVILGDNIFQDKIKADVASFREGAKIFLKEVKMHSGLVLLS